MVAARHPMFHAALVLAFAGTLASLPDAASAAAQRRKPPAPDGPDPMVPVSVALQVGGARYDSTAPGVCLHIADGSIYDAPAAMYSVRQTGATRRLNMTLYRLKGGGDMLTLNVTVGRTTHTVTTVKVKQNGVVAGSGTAKLTADGKGGTLTIDAKDAGGVAIAGTVRCDAFTAPVEANGN